jgi:hypothetical protein
MSAAMQLAAAQIIGVLIVDDHQAGRSSGGHQ